MPITLTKEDGTGIANANTYVESAEVDTYATNHGYSEWTGDADTKASAILRGMMFIESFNFKGRKVDRDQSLKWPRIEVYDEDGYLLDSEDIPNNLQSAVCEAAYREIQSPGALQTDLSAGIKRDKTDVLETEWFQGAPPQTYYQIITHLLSGLIENIISVPVSRT